MPNQPMPAHNVIFEHLDMLSKGSGLFRVDAARRSAAEKKVLQDHPWRTRILACLKEAQEFHAHWVYFRLVTDAGAPRPELFIYDWQAVRASPEEETARLAEHYHALWNYGRVPLALVLGAANVSLYNLLPQPELDSSGAPLPPQCIESGPVSPTESLATAGAATRGIAAVAPPAWKRFSARQFDNGAFWEAPENQGLSAGAANSIDSLVLQMRDARKRIESATVLDAPLEDKERFVRRLLIITLMVRFLEEREILPPGYFKDQEFVGVERFTSLLRHPRALLRAIARMEADFNGDVFHLDDRTRELLGIALESTMEPIADFADGRIDGKQMLFWQLYSFRHLPVEVVSYVYEDFLGGKSQSYFTPHHLVDLLLDEAMPEAEVLAALERNDPRDPKSDAAYPVLDPACGSGVFLVGAWRRLVECFATMESAPAAEHLKRLMTDNLFGVDIQRDSVELTIFSLCVALCSTFPADPKNKAHVFELLKQFKFPNLKQRNVSEGDFFLLRDALLKDSRRFQLCIGNPPFESDLETDEQTALDGKREDEDGKTWVPVPDRNISYLFLRGVMPLVAEGGTACMVQPSGLIYNEKPAKFRRCLLGNWDLFQILDFASIKGLFTTRKKAKAKESEAKVGVTTIAVFLSKQPPDEKKLLLHATFRRTAAFHQRQIFEIDTHDLHWIPRELAASEPRVWKANLLGGGRLLETYKSFDEETLGAFIKRMKKERNWVSSEGFIEADLEQGVKFTTDAERLEAGLTKKSNRLSWSLLDTASFDENGIDPVGIRTHKIEWFERPRADELFSPPHILIKEHPTFPIAIRKEGERLMFKDQIIGIAAPASDVGELERVYRYLIEVKPFAEFFAAFGSKFLITRQAVLLKKNIMDLPFPENGKLVFRGVQKYLRDDVMEFMIPLIKDTEETRLALAAPASEAEVQAFGEVFAELMASAYRDFRFTGLRDLGTGWCAMFWNGTETPPPFGDSEALRTYLDDLLSHESGRTLRTSRIVRHFDGKAFYIIKPKPRRYWLKSAGVRDADEIFAELIQITLEENAAKKREQIAR